MKKHLFWATLRLPLLSLAAGERVDIARLTYGDLIGWQTRQSGGLASTVSASGLRRDLSMVLRTGSTENR